jgi:hypothetical protein
MRHIAIVLLVALAFAPFLNAGIFTPEELDYLLAPIALYPDPLLAQVLVAAGFPRQIVAASRVVRSGGADIGSRPWDASVKAVAHYPTVIAMMAEDPSWTAALGEAYANQPEDVMEAVQRLRREARDAGNLESNSEQQVIETDGYIEILPVDSEYLFVPEYDPGVVYEEDDEFEGGPDVSYGPGYPLGPWLDRTCDWPHHRVGPKPTVPGRALIEAAGAAADRVLSNPAIENRTPAPSAPKARPEPVAPEPLPAPEPEVSAAPPPQQAVQQATQEAAQRATEAVRSEPPAAASPDHGRKR